MKARKLKKGMIILLATIVAIAILGITVSSFLARHLIYKDGEKLTGRRIEVTWAYVNPFTGYIYLKNLKIYEQQSDNVFFTAESLSINITMIKILRKVYEVSELTLHKPLVYLKQGKQELNISDLIQRFSSDTTKKKNPVQHKINILDIHVINGEFHYIEKTIPINYYIKHIRFDSPGKWYNSDSMAFRLSLFSGPSAGEINAEGTVNLKTLDYRMQHLRVKDFNLDIIQQYMKELSNYGHFSAVFNADIIGTGNFSDRGKTNSTGMISLSDFHLGRSTGEDYVSFKRFMLHINRINPNGYVYHYDSATISQLNIKYERYDYLDNFQRMFGKGGANVKAVNAERQHRFNLIIEVAHFIREIAKNFFKSNYQVGKLAIYDGNFGYNDFSKIEKFSMAAYAFNLVADSIDRKKHSLTAEVKAQIKPFGTLRINVGFNPKDTGEFDINYHLNHLPLAMFNPYVISFTSFPLDGGTLQLNGHWTVKNNSINSTNHLQLLHPHLAQRLKRKDAKRLPVPLILAFIKQRNNNIDYEIPVTGSLRNPSLDPSDIVSKLITNIFVKPVSIPYTTEVKQVENNIDKYQRVKWPLRLASLGRDQEKFLKKMNNFLEETPEASLSVSPIWYEDKEKEYILYFEAKKRYYLAAHRMDKHSFDDKDSVEVEKMSAKDYQFIQTMNKRIKDTAMMFTIQEKCAAYIGKLTYPDSSNSIHQGKKVVDAMFYRLQRQRKTLFLSFFKNDDIKKRISFLKDSFIVPYDGFTSYQITYKGDIPEDLKKAYTRLADL